MLRIIGSLGGIIFGLFFAGIALFIANETVVPTFLNWLEMRNWHSTEATLFDINGADNETKAKYRYTWMGLEYQGDRVYVATFNDNIGSYHKKLQQELKSAQRNHRPLTIWVNPANPKESVIDRDMRWGLFIFIVLFLSVFVFVGGFVIYCVVTWKPDPNQPDTQSLKLEWQRRRGADPEYAKSFHEFRKDHSNALKEKDRAANVIAGAWRENKQWASNKIRSDAKGGVIGIWAFTIIWNAISTPLVFALPEELAKDNYAILIGLLFPLIGLGMLYKAIVMTMEYLKFGVIELVMDPWPGSIGGHLGGTFNIKNLDNTQANLEVEVECVYTYVSGSGKNRSRHENIKWAEKGLASLRRIGHGVQASFRFDVPDNLPDADITQNGDYNFWRLKIKADIPGVDLDRSYNIPVFKTGGKTSQVQHDLSAQADQRRQQESLEKRSAIQRGDFNATDLNRSLQISNKSGQVDLYFPMFRNWGLTLFAAFFAGGFGFATYHIITDVGSAGGFFGVFAWLFSIPFGLVAFFASIALVYVPLNNLSVRITRGNLRIIRRLLIFPIVYKTLKSNEVLRLETSRSGSTGQGTNKIEHFKIYAIYGPGNKVCIAEDIDGRDLADHFKDYLQSKIRPGSL